jgi:hypothetical protein
MKTTLSIFVLLLLTLTACSPKERPFAGEFLPSGMLTVHVPRGVESVTVMDKEGSAVAHSPVFGKHEVDIRFRWLENTKYRVLFDGKVSGTVRAPAVRPTYRLRIHAPVGQRFYDWYLPCENLERPDTVIPVAMHRAEKVDILFEFEKLSDSDTGKVVVHASAHDSGNPGLSLKPDALSDSAELQFEFDKRIWSLQARVSGTPDFKTHRIRAKVEINGFQRTYTLAFVPSDPGSDSLSVVRWSLPTDASGVSSSRHESGTILMPNPLWDRIGSWFGVETKETNLTKPFTFQTIRIENRGTEPTAIMLTSEIVDLATNEESPYFKAPDNNFTGGTDKIISFVNIEAGKTEACILPVYVLPNTPAGAFGSRIAMQRLGSSHILKQVENSVRVVRGDTLFTAWTLGIAILSFGWLVAVLILYRRIVSSLGLRILVLLSLLGSLQFCLSFAGRIISSVMYAVLGPFNCLVGGLLTEVLTYLLVTSILFLVPRVGAMTLAGIVSYIMGGILFGSFGLTDILFLGSGIAFREILLFAFGVTKFKQPTHPPAIFPMMIALGLADAASTFTSLTLHAVFYRLFFADWYILLNVFVTGFFYTCVGVYLGRPLGQSLRKVHV